MIMIRLLLVLQVLAPTLYAGCNAFFTDNDGRRDVEACPHLTRRCEWRSMSREDRASWIASVKCLASLDHQRLSFTIEETVLDKIHSLYDDFAIAHVEMEKSAHKNINFLPWHRWFGYLFAARLRDTCGYAGPTPYWDWSLDVADMFASPVFDPDPVYGLGSAGDCTSSPTSDCLVLDGAFGAHSTLTHDSAPFLTFPVPHTLRRNLSLYSGEVPDERPRNASLTPAIVEKAMHRATPGNFSKLQHGLEWMHDHFHNFIGGDLAGTCPRELTEAMGGDCSHAFTSNDPLFWLHHAQLDRIWSKWQHRHPDNYYAFHDVIHNLTNLRRDPDAQTSAFLHFDRLSTSVDIRKVFNHSAPPLCYYYDENDCRRR